MLESYMISVAHIRILQFAEVYASTLASHTMPSLAPYLLVPLGTIAITLLLPACRGAGIVSTDVRFSQIASATAGLVCGVACVLGLIVLVMGQIRGLTGLIVGLPVGYFAGRTVTVRIGRLGRPTATTAVTPNSHGEGSETGEDQQNPYRTPK